MFARWGALVTRLRFLVLALVTGALLALGAYGADLDEHLSGGGMFDNGSESAQAARIADRAFGRSHEFDVAVLYTAPAGTTVDDPEFSRTITDSLNRLPREHPRYVGGINAAYWPGVTATLTGAAAATPDKTQAIALIALRGDNDTDIMRSYRNVKDAFTIPGIDVQVAGLQPLAGTLNDKMAEDIHRVEILALPAVAILLFFIFGGVVAAALPLIVGGLTMLGANGVVRFVATFTEVNSFVEPIVTMIGLGLAIDYGLFIVSRFREELAAGHDTQAAVRRTVQTAGRTVLFSATMIIVSLGGMLIFPQAFLKSMAYGAIATVSLAALTAVTVLPAILAILGPRVDLLGFERFRKARSPENTRWERSTAWVQRHPRKLAVPLCLLLLFLTVPVGNLIFGGFSERYLPPDNPTRLAQEAIDTAFDQKRSDPLELVFVSDNPRAIGTLVKQANAAPGLTENFKIPSSSTRERGVYRTSTLLVDSDQAGTTIDYLRRMDVPDDVTMLVGGMPAMQKDSIDALLYRIPVMVALVLFLTTVLMFLTFGSLILPIKAALMSALGLGSTLGILTWIFVDGHLAGLLNFTPQPIQSNVLVLIIAIIYGLSTDYEVFLISRMIEARALGASTTDAIRIGTAQTGSIITAAALILLVVTGAFAFSDLVMMQYIAFGMIAALFIDATLLRMLLVPAVMQLLGDRCWWAPEWMRRVQRRVGLGEPILDPPATGENGFHSHTPGYARAR
ncbi:MMPL family transporter [Nocardia sp. NPDC048505]|uniref:MMPL family transporter n=1 Tax=Nocardia sp. NPDC048505 TaxID=3155756 RepID=UPI0033E2EB61